MEIQIIEVEGIQHILIDKGNGEFTSMLKSTYDAMQTVQAEQALPTPPVEEIPIESAPEVPPSQE